MNGTCKLCKQDRELKLSHFIPNFVGKWLKKTSMTGFFRKPSDIDRRKQDLAKEYWLCEDCESLFSVWESKFASNVFYPFVKGESDVVDYTDWMPKFCASLSWRTLTYLRNINPHDDSTPEYLVNEAEEHLSLYLLGLSDNLYQYEQHIFHLGKIDEVRDKSTFPPNINRYFLRSVNMDIIGNGSDLMIYTKLPSFMIFGFIKVDAANKMRASRVSLNAGKLCPTNVMWPDGFIDYISEKCKEITVSQRKMSETQKQKIEKTIFDNPRKARESETLEAFLHDYEMFGEDVFDQD